VLFFWRPETSPLIEGLVNFNLASIPDWMTDIDRCVQNRGVVLSRKQQPPSGDALQGDFLTRLFASLLSIDAGHSVDYEGLPISFVYLPVFDSWNVNDRGVAAVLFAMINWVRQNFTKTTTELSSPKTRLDSEHLLLL
jgi:hypothetical protein